LQFGGDVHSVERVFDVDALAAEDRSTWSGAARLARLVEVRAVQERLDAEVLRLVADCDAVDAWSEACLGAVSWLATHVGVVRSAAVRLVRTARFVRRHERTAKALDAGDVSVPHVEMLAAVAHRRDDLYDRDETVLLDAAATVAVQDFPQAVRTWASLADDELARREAAFAFDRRGFVLSPTTHGAALSGFLDPEAYATVTSTLDEVQPPEGRDDTRSLAQRRADALLLLCERANGGELATSRPIAGAEVVMSHDVFAGHPLANLDSLQCEIAGFGPIPRATAERMLCDCALGRVVKGRSRSSTSGAAPAPCPIGSDGRSCCATGTASSPDAVPRPRGATRTTWCGGRVAGPRASRTACCSAAAITSPSTKAAGSSNGAPTDSRWRGER
jgi:hypothetical protein